MKHLWIKDHPMAPSFVPKGSYYCPFCGCWTSNMPFYKKDTCEERVKALAALRKE